MAEKIFAEAINEAIAEEMRRDSNVFIMGEDIRLSVYGATANLYKEFGEERVLDTPLSENGFFGAAIGASLVGMRPIVETVTSFMWVAMDQLISQAAKMRYMFGGQTKVPLTLFARSGGGTGHAAQHSSAFYSILAHIPGLKVVTPTDPYSVKGLLSAAIRDDDPVFVVNDKKLINMTGFVPDEDYQIELGKGRCLKEGSDITLVGMSYTTVVCQEAAEKLKEIGVDAEVIDLLSLSPLDEDIIIESVKKTNRIVIVDEDNPKASIASEVAAIVSDKAFDYLDAPVKRVTAPHTPVPYSKKLENEFMPDSDDVLQTVKNILDI